MDSYIHRSTITNSQDMKIFINRLFYTQTHTYYSVIKKKKESNLGICNNIVDLEGIILSEISQQEKQISYNFTHK